MAFLLNLFRAFCEFRERYSVISENTMAHGTHGNHGEPTERN